MPEFFTAPPPYEGGCLCSQVRYVAREAPLGARICHCRLCQKAQGSPFLAQASFPKRSMTITGQTGQHQSSRRLIRHFCPNCGTRLFIDVAALELRGLNGCLLPDEAFQAQYHMQCQFAVRPVSDNLPHYQLRSPQFGGPDERVDW